MQQVKIFKGVESDTSTLENEINTWIRQSRATILAITGNIAPQSPSAGAKTAGLGTSAFAASDVILFVLYEPSSN